MTLPRYPAYRDSGVEWLGEVPAHWDVVRLKRLASIRYGIGEPPAYIEDGVPLIRATNVHEGRVLTDGLVFVDPAEIPEKRIVWLQEGDIIVVRSGAYTGDTAIIRRNICPAIAGFDMVVRVSGVVPDFLQFALLSSYLKQDQIDLERARAAQPHLNAEELGGCLVVLPSLDEQIAIAAFLDRETAKIDGLVREQERLIELLAEKRRAVVSHAVTKGLDRHAPMKDSGIDWLGEVPAHWEVTKLGRHLDVLSGYAFPSAGFSEDEADVRLLRGVNVGIQEIRWTEVVYWERTADDGLDRFLLAPGQLVMGMDRPWIGTGARVAILTQDDAPCLLLQRVAALTPLPGLSRDFVFLILQSRDFEDYFTPDMTGVSVPHISPEQIRSFPFARPPLEEQLQIAAYLRDDFAKLDALKAEAERAVALLKERRAALISAAVTGKIDVRGRVEEAA